MAGLHAKGSLSFLLLAPPPGLRASEKAGVESYLDARALASPRSKETDGLQLAALPSACQALLNI